MEKGGRERTMKGGRDAVEGEGAEQVEQNRSFSFSLSLSFFGSVSTFNLSDDNGVTGDIANRRKTTGGRGTESLIKIH